MLSFIQSHPIILAPLIGVLPAFVWLWFWLKEDVHPEPHRMITLSFLGGLLSVLLVLPLQKLVYTYVPYNKTLAFILWAGIEEVMKFIIVYFTALRTKANDEPEDSIIYMIICALGFVSLENTFFIFDSVKAGNITESIITGNLRFVGASLLHIISSGTIGIFMAISFYKNKIHRWAYTIVGVILAIALHTAFNLFIMSESGENIVFVFSGVWVGIIILLLLFEKVKNSYN